MSANVILPTGLLVLVVGVLVVVNVNKTTTDTYIHSSTSVFSENAEETEVDPEKPSIELEEDLKPVQGADVEFCTPKNRCVNGIEVSPGVYQPHGGVSKDEKFSIVIDGKSKGIWSSGHKISLGGLRSTKKR